MKKLNKREQKVIKDFVKLLTEDAKDKNDVCPRWYIEDVMKEYIKNEKDEPCPC